MVYSVSKDDFTVTLTVTQLGKDYAALLSGGKAASLGCVVTSIPRPSLTDPDLISCTSSVLNFVSCLDEDICRFVAESLCCHFKTRVACVGGVEITDFSQEHMEQLRYMVYQLVSQVTGLGGQEV